MNKKLYVGNLEWGVSDSDLKECFSRAGEVTEAFVILDRNTGRSRGFGFVEMKTEGGAEKAIQSLNGEIINNRTIMVKEADSESREDSEFIGAIKKFVLSEAKQGDTTGFVVGEKHFTLSRDR